MPELTHPQEHPLLDSLSIQQLIDLRYELSAAKKEIAAQERAVKSEIDAIDAKLIEYHKNNPEVSEVSGATAKVKWSEETHYSPEAGFREDVRDWLFENGHQHLITWHFNRAATDEFVNTLGSMPPHTTAFDKTKISCRKL